MRPFVGMDMTNPAQTLYEAVGAIHLHSDFSDGSLPIPEIAGIAGRKSLDYLMFSDHNTLESKRKGLEGWYGNVLVLIGYEINDPDDRNHYLAFRVDREVKEGTEAKDYVRQVKEMGGFGVIAHPAEKRDFSDAYPPYPWTAWDADGYDGIEIWNQLSEWLEGVTRRNYLYRMMHPLRSIRYPVWETLERWDRVNRIKRIVGLGGIDVHGFRTKILGFLPVEIYPYKVQFRSIRTHLLTEKPFRDGEHFLSFEDSEREVYRALFSGRCFISNFRVGDGKGFRFWAERNNEVFPMGSRLSCRGELVFRVQAPLDGTIRLLCDGRELEITRGRMLTHRADKEGVFRVEIYRKKRGWIYSNPIVVTA